MKILIDTHSHSLASGHAYSTVMENFEFASKNTNLVALATTEHSVKMPGGPDLFYFYNLKVIPNELFGIKSYSGVEYNILDTDGTVDNGAENNYTEIFDSLDVKIASLHPPCIAFGNKEENTRTLINTMKKNKIDVLGHLGDPRYPFDIDEVIKFAKESNTLIEINNSSCSPNSPRYDLDFQLKIIDGCIKHNAYMTFGSDAHFCTEVGNFDKIIKIFNDNKIGDQLVITTSLEKFHNFINENK